MKIGFIGLGKLGLECAETFAEWYDVVGYDVQAKKTEKVRIAKNIAEVVLSSEFIFVAVQTPHNVDYDGSKPSMSLPVKDFDYGFVEDVLSEINIYIQPSQTVVLISTVLPGICRLRLRPLITQGKFLYNPYLIAMGTVRQDMLNPEMVIIGSDTCASEEWLPLRNLYGPLLQKDVRIVMGTYEEAESIKIFYNTFISMKISLVNMIQDVAQNLGNMNVDIVTQALAESTQRIMGPAYMKAGMGDGGPCHPRDNIALRHLAERLGLGYDLFGAIMESREIQAKNMASFLRTFNLPVIILGESYKPGVPYTDGSSSRLLGHFIQEAGLSVQYDVFSNTPAVYVLAHDVRYDENIFAPQSIVVDPWRAFSSGREDIQVVYYGNTRSGN